MSEIGDLLIGIATLVGSLASGFVLIWNTVVGPRRATKQAAKKAATEVAEKVLEAIADGEITPEEIADIQRTQHAGEVDDS